MLGDLDASNFAADALKLRKQIQALQFPRHPEACIAGNASSSKHGPKPAWSKVDIGEWGICGSFLTILRESLAVWDKGDGVLLGLMEQAGFSRGWKPSCGFTKIGRRGFKRASDDWKKRQVSSTALHTQRFKQIERAKIALDGWHEWLDSSAEMGEEEREKVGRSCGAGAFVFTDSVLFDPVALVLPIACGIWHIQKEKLRETEMEKVGISCSVGTLLCL